MVDAHCDANCNASVQAKAECTPPSVDVVFTGAASVDAAGQLIATLKANLPIIFSLRAKFQAMGDLAVQLSGNIGAVVDIKVACIPAVVAAVGTAASDVGDSLSASVSVTASVGQ